MPGEAFKTDGLPFLPGYRPDPTFSRKSFHKAHLLEFRDDGVAVVKDRYVSKKEQSIQDTASNNLLNGPSFGDGILRFFGSFNSQGENNTIIKHNVVVCIFSDNTIQVYEPVVENSGVPQGRIVRRCHVPKLGHNRSLNFTDFHLGQQVSIFGRDIYLEKCDGFTADVLKSQGDVVEEDLVQNGHIPTTIHFESKPPAKLNDDDLRISPSSRPAKSFVKFRANDGKVLRFYGVWDDTKTQYGYLHRLIIHYYLADDMVEIREEMEPAKEEKIAVTSQFLKKSVLPKQVLPVEMGPVPASKRKSQFYTQHDFEIGMQINVHGRVVVLCDCDQFTREYYSTQLGRSLKEGVSLHKIQGINTDGSFIVEKPPVNIEDVIVEDEITILPENKPAAPIHHEYSEQDAINVIAKLKSTDELEMQRTFNIRMYLRDETMAIFEKAVENSGLSSGKFLGRGRVRKPKSLIFYGPKHLTIGSELKIYGRTFQVMDADQFTKDFFAEKHLKNDQK